MAKLRWAWSRVRPVPLALVAVVALVGVAAGGRPAPMAPAGTLDSGRVSVHQRPLSLESLRPADFGDWDA